MGFSFACILLVMDWYDFLLNLCANLILSWDLYSVLLLWGKFSVLV